MANTTPAAKPETKRRETLGAVTAFLNTKDPRLFVFRNIGDRVRGTVVGAQLVDSEISGNVRRNAAGQQKRHLQVYLTSPEGDKVVLNVQSQNQRESLADALQKANVDGLAKGDYLTMEYIDDDEVLREGLNAARVYETVVTPAE
jgi:hypothetical protein